MLDLAPGFGIAFTKEASQRLLRVAVDLDLSALAAAGKLYATTADGIADTVDGEYFFLAEDGADSFPLYLNDSEVAVDQGIALVAKAALDAFMEAPPHVAGAPGGLLTNDTGSSDVADPTWIARADIGNQPVFSVDIATPANIQLQKTSTVGSFTATPTGGKLRFQPTALGSTSGFRVAGTTVAVGVGDIVRVKLELVAAPEGVSWGLALAILPDPPTPGGSMVSLDADTPVVSARGDNGGLGLLNPAGDVYPDRTVDAGGSGTAWTSGQEIELVYSVLSEESARVTVLIDGSNEFTRTFGNYPATGYVAPGVYLVDVDDEADVDLPQVYHPSLDVPKIIHLAASSPDAFETLDDAIEDYRYDPSRGTLDLIFKGGTISQSIFEGTLPFDLPGLRELTIRSTTGTRARIDGSIAVSPTFTNIPGSEVWHFPTPPFDANATYGGLICVTPGITQTFGLNDSFTLDKGFRFPSRLGTTIAYNDVSFVRGRLSVHLTGTYAGKTLVRLWDGGDPNDHDWRWSSRNACIYLPASVQDGWNGRRLNIENIDMFGGFAYGLYADRWMLDLTSVGAYATVNGYPFELNHCGGNVYGPIVEGYGLDAYHTNDAGTKPLEGADPELWFWDAIARGGAALYAPDGFSNHGRPRWFIRGGEVIAPGKAGIATAGGIDARDILLQGAPEAGFTLANTTENIAANGPDRTASLRRAIVRGNTAGVLVNMASGTDASLILDMDDILFDTNVQSSARIINAGTNCIAQINYDPNRLRFAGATPSFGADFQNSSGTFNALTTRAKV